MTEAKNLERKLDMMQHISYGCAQYSSAHEI
jgi:hypothetical protein